MLSTVNLLRIRVLFNSRNSQCLFILNVSVTLEESVCGSTDFTFSACRDLQQLLTSLTESI